MAASDNLTSPPPKKRFGRILFRFALVGGGGLILSFLLLTAMTVLNFRREVAPPEISGPHRITRTVAKSTSVSTSGTLPAMSSTSGTLSPLDLDDFPHLSPAMRELAQAWFAQCSETEKALDTISDPAQRAWALAPLIALGKIRETFLNQSLNWENQTYEEALEFLRYSLQYRGMGSYVEWQEFGKQNPEFFDALGKQVEVEAWLRERIYLELCITKQEWYKAWKSYRVSGTMPTLGYSRVGELRAQFPLDEEVYCLRQMGKSGWICMPGRIYQRTFDTLWWGQPPDTKSWLGQVRSVGDLPYELLLQADLEKEESPKNPD